MVFIRVWKKKRGKRKGRRKNFLLNSLSHDREGRGEGGGGGGNGLCDWLRVREERGGRTCQCPLSHHRGKKKRKGEEGRGNRCSSFNGEGERERGGRHNSLPKAFCRP